LLVAGDAGIARCVRPASVSGPVLVVCVGLFALVLICFLVLALLDPGSIVNGSYRLNRALRGEGREHRLEP
jgi:hypothetical protein